MTEALEAEAAVRALDVGGTSAESIGERMSAACCTNRDGPLDLGSSSGKHNTHKKKKKGGVLWQQWAFSNLCDVEVLCAKRNVHREGATLAERRLHRNATSVSLHELLH